MLADQGANGYSFAPRCHNMPATKIFSFALYFLGIATQLVCARLILKRKLQKDYYFFLSYLIFQALSGVLLNALYLLQYAQTYFYAYWIQNALLDIFAFAVFNELFCAAFKPFAGLRDMAKVVFRWAGVALLLVGAVVFCSSSASNLKKVSLIIINVDRSICVMQCGLLLFLFMGSSYLGLSKRSRVFGISLGFGLLAIMELIFLTVMSTINYQQHRVVEWFNTILPVCTVAVQVIWMLYLAKPEPARETINVPVTSPLLRWNEVAMALGHSGGRVAFIDRPEPFMPNVERMVEEVMKRDMFVDRH